MKKNKYIQYSLIISLLLGMFSSCNDFLDELPDNRTALDNTEKIGKILVSAYPGVHYSIATELSSDNIVYTGQNNPNTTRYYDQIATWKDVTEKSNADDLSDFWASCYLAIANANEALKAIEQNNINTPKAEAFKGEALVARAYSHFILVNVFAKNYNKQTSDTDLGITYVYNPETTLNPKYKRNTVKEVYEAIDKDLEEGLPLIDDSVYDIPKYHFNKSAAYAFAARFNLYYEKWQKAHDYASKALGATPELRNWKGIGDLVQTETVITNDFIRSDKKANLLLQTSSSNAGLIYGPYYLCARYTHTQELASLETVKAKGPWGVSNHDTFWLKPFVYGATNLDKVLLPKQPYMFQYTDIVAKIGYRKTVNVLFSTDEALLIRAEASIMLKEYADGVADLNLWTKNYLRNGAEFTQSELEDFYSNLAYSIETEPTQKKVLNPYFSVDNGTQENLIHCVLQYRRILTLHEGLRWFDIKRYGIEVNRYMVDNGSIIVQDKLTPHDLRQAIQIPQEVIQSGLIANPR